MFIYITILTVIFGAIRQTGPEVLLPPLTIVPVAVLLKNTHGQNLILLMLLAIVPEALPLVSPAIALAPQVQTPAGIPLVKPCAPNIQCVLVFLLALPAAVLGILVPSVAAVAPKDALAPEPIAAHTANPNPVIRRRVRLALTASLLQKLVRVLA